MLPISPSSPRLSSTQSALEATRGNTNAISQDRSDNNFTASGSSLAGRTEEPHSLLPISQPTQQKLSLAEQRWVAWVNSRDISEPEQQQRQALATKLKDRIQFSGEHIEARYGLSIKDCPSLTSLPEGLVVESYLSIENCPGLTSLPEGLVVANNLWIEDCPGFTSLPEGLGVGGDLKIWKCSGLTSLPEDLKVKGGLEIKSCPGLTSLPEGLVVESYLSIENCPGLTSLPEGLVVADNLWIEDCPGLTSLAGLKIQGSLVIKNCPGFTSLPEDLKVKGGLEIKSCPGLTSLPEGLEVGSYLYIKDCPGLTSLPEGLGVKGELWIIDCPGITSLPLSILKMPPRSDGELREITLENTGITQETRSRIEAWLGEHLNLKVRLHWSEARADNLDGFVTLEQALDFRRHRHYPGDP